MTHRKRDLIAGILYLAVALMPVAAVSGPYEDGLDAHDSGDYASGDYATALRLWRPMAGNKKATPGPRLGNGRARRGQGRNEKMRTHIWATPPSRLITPASSGAFWDPLARPDGRLTLAATSL